jgi:hypothetical protein
MMALMSSWFFIKFFKVGFLIWLFSVVLRVILTNHFACTTNDILRGRHRHVRSAPINVLFLWEDGLNGRHSALSLKILTAPSLFINHSINRLLINFKSVQVMFSFCVCKYVRVRRT